MTNPNEHIEEFLKYYFRLKTAPQYAVLLKGNWGIGKTWFLNNLIKSWKNTDYEVKTPLYVSLYGVTSFEDIEGEFFRQLHPVLSSKGMLLAGKVAKGFMKGMFKIDWDGDGKSDGSLSIQAPELNIPDYLSDTDGLVLIFDDLERASMDLEVLLGYINQYVEHQGYKVIIIANEEELFEGKKDDNSNETNSGKTNIGYRRIKEKLIGKTFEIQPRLESAIENFIKEIETESTQKFFKDNFKLISDLYQYSGYWNLRHLRQALMDFDRLLDSISNDIKEKEGVIEELLSIYLTLSFEIKSGHMIPSDIHKFENSFVTELMHRIGDKEFLEDKVDSIYTKIKEKYPEFDPTNMLLEKSTWCDIFDKGLIQKEKIEESLKKSRYFNSDEQKNWVQLWHFIYLRDVDFEKILEEVKRDFKDYEYKNIGEIKHVTGLFLELIDKNLLSMSKKDVLDLAKENIDNLNELSPILINNLEFMDDTASSGLEYRNRNDDEFKVLLDYIISSAKDRLKASLPLIAEELLRDMDKDSNDFYRKLTTREQHSQYIETPILTYINPMDFWNKFIQYPPAQWKAIFLIIYKRYMVIDEIHVQALLPEIAWLQEIVNLLNEEIKIRKGKVSAYQLDELSKKYLLPSLKILVNRVPKDKSLIYFKWFYKASSTSRSNIFIT